MSLGFYKMRANKQVSGVLAGLADKFDWDLSLTRILFVLTVLFTNVPALIIYIVLAIFLPYKEDLLEERYGTGPRKRKDAKIVNEDDGWFW